MLLITKYSETLILKTTKYWDGLRTVLDPCGRVRHRVTSWSRLFFLVLECLVECRMKKALKLVIEYAVKSYDGDTRLQGRVMRSSSGLATGWGHSTAGSSDVVEWWSEDGDEITRPGGRVVVRRWRWSHSTWGSSDVVEWWSEDGDEVTRPGGRVMWSSGLLRSWSSYSTSGSSGLSWSGPLLPDSSSIAPNHLKSTKLCNMHANLS